MAWGITGFVPHAIPRPVANKRRPNFNPSLLDLFRLLVSDWGAGVDVDLEERIFEPFFTTRLERNASGLGLTISRRFLQARGGSLQLRQASKPTIFVVEMKAAQT